MEESRVYLLRVATRELMEASLCDEITDGHLDLWEASWRPALDVHCAGLEESDKPEDVHWNWRANASRWRKYLTYRSFAVICGGELQGLMLTSDLEAAQLSTPPGKPMIYVELLATAPWNRPEVQTPPRYRGTGRILILAAIELSRALDFGGRIGLHSLPEAEPFYRDKCGMTNRGLDKKNGLPISR